MDNPALHHGWSCDRNGRTLHEMLGSVLAADHVSHGAATATAKTLPVVAIRAQCARICGFMRSPLERDITMSTEMIRKKKTETVSDASSQNKISYTQNLGYLSRS